MPEAIRKVNVIGHLNPDTDSICAAISYAYLKNQIDSPIYEARRAGTLNRETAFVLKHFGFEEPQLITTVTPQIKDAEIQEQPKVDGNMSLYNAWNLMQDVKLDTLVVTDDANHLEGLIAVKDIANANMGLMESKMLSETHTSYKNIISTLSGSMLVGDPDNYVSQGSIRIGTCALSMTEIVGKGDIVVVAGNHENQLLAIKQGASCLIVSCDGKVDNDVIAAAQQAGCAVITTPRDTFEVARLLTMAVPVKSKMLTNDILKFSVNTSIDDARKAMAKSRHRFFPVLDENGAYAGLISSPGLLKVRKKHVILVDHNERTQAVNGLDQAEIMEIVDHHRIGSVETTNPITFRNVPVGCTCTILYGLYREYGVEIPKNIAGLMLSAILSDTLAFRSPTCTPIDVNAGKALAGICGEDIESYSEKMFDAGADLTGRTAEEVFHSDYKVFSRGNAKFGVGQGSFMTENSRKAAEALVGPFLKTAAEAEELPMIFYMFTDVKSQVTEMLYYGAGAEEVLERAFNVTPDGGIAVLPGVVSRKKQVVPSLMSALQFISDED
ncbi:putative manganese-dependent inorganic diphosphatase [Lancefieldella sp. Marseille-Q7238]|uniref:putative manganese-dependent inorganic diphosphatase n=1 Tax=Lancefieldella sp. Marseille-Q7238 TaxID=3022127 RepID=UPI0024A81527|nr:putative manganese-dependent inorganic diphosphatase [Lancefieldella sp. Marseille-Q7238]